MTAGDTAGAEAAGAAAARPSAAGPATSLLFDVFATAQAVGRLLAAAMRDGPLTPAEYAIYSAIFELEAAPPTALAARLGMPLTTLADQLRVLDARGHLARLPHPADRRSHRVALTAAGREVHRAANAGFEAAHRAFIAALPAGEERARAGLDDIRAAAERAASDRGGAAARSVAAVSTASGKAGPVASPRRSVDPGG